METKNLLTLQRNEIKSFINSIDNIFCDVDGVLWNIRGELVEGTSETFKKLLALNKKIYFVSNNSIFGIKHLHQKLSKVIPNLSEECVITPCVAIIWYLKSVNFNKKIFVLGSAKMKEDLADAGFELASTGPDCLEEDFGTFFKELECVTDVGAVIFDFDFNFNFFKLSAALNCLKKKDVLYMVGCWEEEASVCNIPIFSPGALQSIFAKLTNREPMALGKPNEGMQNYLQKKINPVPSKSLFVGDMLKLDVKMGKKCGFKTLLVLTGISQLADMKDCTKDDIPDYYIPAFGDLCKYI